jgi:hypothetical protein
MAATTKVGIMGYYSNPVALGGGQWINFIPGIK